MLKPTAFILMLITLSGCTSEYFIRKFMDGPKFCHSEEMNRVVQNNRSVRNISNRLRRDFVLVNMPYYPDKTEQIKTSDGLVYLADYYQTTASFICGGEGVFGKHKPVFYLGGVVIGIGDEFYKKKLRHKIVDVEVLAH